MNRYVILFNENIFDLDAVEQSVKDGKCHCVYWHSYKSCGTKYELNIGDQVCIFNGSIVRFKGTIIDKGTRENVAPTLIEQFWKNKNDLSIFYNNNDNEYIKIRIDGNFLNKRLNSRITIPNKKILEINALAFDSFCKPNHIGD